MSATSGVPQRLAWCTAIDEFAALAADWKRQAMPLPVMRCGCHRGMANKVVGLARHPNVWPTSYRGIVIAADDASLPFAGILARATQRTLRCLGRDLKHLELVPEHELACVVALGELNDSLVRVIEDRGGRLGVLGGSCPAGLSLRVALTLLAGRTPQGLPSALFSISPESNVPQDMEVVDLLEAPSQEDLVSPRDVTTFISHGRDCALVFPGRVLCGKTTGPPSGSVIPACDAGQLCYRRDIVNPAQITPASETNSVFVFLAGCFSVNAGSNLHGEARSIARAFADTGTVAVAGSSGVNYAEDLPGPWFTRMVHAGLPLGESVALLSSAARYHRSETTRYQLLGDPGLARGQGILAEVTAHRMSPTAWFADLPPGLSLLRLPLKNEGESRTSLRALDDGVQLMQLNGTTSLVHVVAGGGRSFELGQDQFERIAQDLSPRLFVLGDLQALDVADGISFRDLLGQAELALRRAAELSASASDFSDAERLISDLEDQTLTRLANLVEGASWQLSDSLVPSARLVSEAPLMCPRCCRPRAIGYEWQHCLRPNLSFRQIVCFRCGDVQETLGHPDCSIQLHRTNSTPDGQNKIRLTVELSQEAPVIGLVAAIHGGRIEGFPYQRIWRRPASGPIELELIPPEGAVHDVYKLRFYAVTAGGVASLFHDFALRPHT